IIIVKDETSKTNRRIVPILPALKDWLWPIRKKSGAVGSTSC
ncbi:MAG: hypothetical protein JWO82_3152, partial [Akkermansiaceae bacterium]|nr:hypothetical protein [Akkermansiaceae bacterium]